MQTNDVSGLLVLRAKQARTGETKKFDILRAVETNDIDHALADLPDGDYVVVDPGSLATYRVGYVTLQKNERV